MTEQRFTQRRRASHWHRIRFWLIVILALLGAGTLIWLFWFSATFGVHKVEINGTETLKPHAVELAAAVPKGQPLVRVNTTQIESHVSLLARVESVDVRRHWPNTITVNIRERHAIAWIRDGTTIRGVDRFGVDFRSYAKPPKGLIEVRITANTPKRRQDAMVEATKVIGKIHAKDTGLESSIDHVTAGTKDSVELALTKGRTVRWGSAADSTAKITVLKPLLKIKARTYDVSAPEQPTTRK